MEQAVAEGEIEMPSQTELNTAFRVYFEEIRRCIEHKCYWALLHIVIVLPDICAALESKDGQTHGNRYKDWCHRYLPNGELYNEDWYEIRKIVLHQGKTRATKGRYGAYIFSQPNAQGISVHREIDRTGRTTSLILDVGRLAKEIRVAMQKWFAELEAGKAPSRTCNVERNLSSLVCVQSREVNALAGMFSIQLSLTTSSSI